MDLGNPFLLILLFGVFGLTVYVAIFAIIVVRNHQNFRRDNSSIAEDIGIADDLEDVGRGRITTTQVLGIATLLLSVAYLILLSSYHKFSAAWGNINVLMVGVFVSAVFGAIVISTEWFKDQEFRTPNWVYGITVAGIVLSLISGVYFSEPDWRHANGDYRQEDTRGYVMYQSYHSTYISTGSGGGGGSSATCTGKSCGYAALVIILIIIILAVVIMSATIPHFWVVGAPWCY